MKARLPSFMLFLLLFSLQLPAQTDTLLAVLDHLNIRQKPSLEADVMGQVREGDTLWGDGWTSGKSITLTLRGVEQTGKWIAVRIPGSDLEGWVFEKAALPHQKVVFIGAERRYKTLGEYFSLANNPTGVVVKVDPGVYWHEGETWIQGNNLVIEGMGEVDLRCKNKADNVIWLVGNNIVVRKLRLRHYAPPGIDEPYNCSGNVIALDNASNVLIADCDINGCGKVGVHDNVGNSDITLRNNYIHNNSVAPFGDIDGQYWMEEVPDHPTFIFENNRVENNGPDRVKEEE